MTHVKRLFLFALVLGASHVEIRSSQLVLMDQLASEYKQLRQQVKGLKDKNSILGGFIVAGNLDGVSERNLQEGISRMQRVVAENGVVTTSEPTEPLMDPGLSLSAKAQAERAAMFARADRAELEELFKEYRKAIQSILLNPEVSDDFKQELREMLDEAGIDLTVVASSLPKDILEKQVNTMAGFAPLAKNPTLDMLKKEQGPAIDGLKEIVKTTEENIQGYNPANATSTVDFLLKEIEHIMAMVESGKQEMKEAYKDIKVHKDLFGFYIRAYERQMMDVAETALETLAEKASGLFADKMLTEEELKAVKDSIESARDALSLVPTIYKAILQISRDSLYDYTVSDLKKMQAILQDSLKIFQDKRIDSLGMQKNDRVHVNTQINAIKTLLAKVKGKGFGSSEYSVGELLRLGLIADLSENTKDLFDILKKDKITLVTPSMLEGIHGRLKKVIAGFSASDTRQADYIQGYLQGLLLANGITSASYVTKLDARKVDKLLRLLKQVPSKTVAARS